jgi:hypothetical protein
MGGRVQLQAKHTQTESDGLLEIGVSKLSGGARHNLLEFNTHPSSKPDCPTCPALLGPPPRQSFWRKGPWHKGQIEAHKPKSAGPAWRDGHT